MLTDYTLDELSIGSVLPVQNGYVANLARTQAPPPGLNETAQWDEGKQRWTAGRLVLRGEGDRRDLFCIDATHGGWASFDRDQAFVITGGSFPYRGGLKIICVPRGSEWSLTLSDMPVARQLPPSDVNFSGSNYVPVNPPASPKRPGG